MSQTCARKEELPHFDSQGFLGLVKYNSNSSDSAKRAKKYLRSFKKIVHANEENLNGKVNHQKAQLSLLEVEFSQLFGKAYSSVLCGISAGGVLAVHPSPLNSNSRNSLYNRSTKILKGATSLVEQLQISCRELDDQQTLLTPNTDSQVDFDMMMCIFDGGRKVGEKRVETILTNSDKTQPDHQLDEYSHQLFDKCTRMACDLTWYEAVCKQERAVMRLADTLLLE